MITTICLNPCFDKTVEMDELKLGEVNRIRRLRRDAGGKGMNVAVVAQRLGLEVQCIGTMGNDGATQLSEMMDAEGLKHRFLRVPGRVRTNLKLLLRNEKAGKQAAPVLPMDLSLYNNILVVGENATRSLTQGGGSSELKTLRDISPLEALQSQASSLKPQISIDYAQGYASGRAMYDHVDKVDPAVNAKLKAEALEKARKADIIIYIGGLNKNHRQDCENGDRESYDLPFGQNELIAELATLKPKTAKLIVVTFGGNPYATPWLQQVDALVHCWYLGSEAGTSLVNVLTGKVNPSGKLPVTFAKNYSDYPYTSFGERAYPGLTGIEAPANSAGEVPRRQVYYDEDLFVGYRGFDKLGLKANFPFGFGLSYTTFQYDKPAIVRRADGSWQVTVSVTNTGSREGKETVQLYVGQQRYAKTMKKPDFMVERPVKELKDFAKLSLKPGETKTATFVITEGELAVWDETAHQWTTPAGKYRAYIGASSADIRGTADFTL